MPNFRTSLCPSTCSMWTLVLCSAIFLGGCGEGRIISATGPVPDHITAVDCDSDTVPCDICPGFDDSLDTDQDGAPNGCDACPDNPAKIQIGACGCATSDVDTDGDGTADCNDECVNDANKSAAGFCGCGVADSDTDRDGTFDCVGNGGGETQLGNGQTVADACDPGSHLGNTGCEANIPPSILSQSLPTAVTGQSYTATPDFIHHLGTEVWHVEPSTLPPGLALNTTTGQLSGIPTTSGPYFLNLSLTDDGGETNHELPLWVAEPNAGISPGQLWHYAKGTDNPPPDWNESSFDESDWDMEEAALGYGTQNLNTELVDMKDSYVSLYLRREFYIEDLGSLEHVNLSILYDDGYVAYLNGTELSRANMPAGAPTADTLASSDHVAVPPYLLSQAAISLNLVQGMNVLSIEVHNDVLGSSSFVAAPSLTFVESPVDPPDLPIADYDPASSLTSLSFITNGDLSGITWNWDTNTFFLIQNRNEGLWEVDLDFFLLRTLEAKGFGDSEDIAYLGAGEFAIVNESSQLYIGEILPLATELRSSDFQRVTFGVPEGNRGPEGVTYDPATKTFYVVKEKSPMAVKSFIRPNATGNVRFTALTIFDAETVFDGIATDLSGVYFNASTQRLLILSDESHVVMDVALDGTIASTLPMADNSQHEGITVDGEGTLIITSEPNLYRLYQAP
jgi:uncharacterized protein YjiK